MSRAEYLWPHKMNEFYWLLNSAQGEGLGRKDL